jgi:hypothetical protein
MSRKEKTAAAFKHNFHLSNFCAAFADGGVVAMKTRLRDQTKTVPQEKSVFMKAYDEAVVMTASRNHLADFVAAFEAGGEPAMNKVLLDKQATIPIESGEFLPVFKNVLHTARVHQV